uniref:[histone H3]-lysine(27) N-trimethyltransferase n=1 Tax=Parascaris univalens TaxID=6257 RepID=A0A914ZF37_PARUN
MVSRRKTIRSHPVKSKSKISKKNKKTPEVEKHGLGEESDNSIDWGDASIDEEILGDLLDCVKEAYDEVRSEYDRVVETDGLDLYLSVLEEPPKEYEVIGHVAEPDPQPAPPEPTNATIRSAANAVIQKCPTHTIEHVMATPRMQYWTMTEINVTCKDERKLSHMPFMGDRDEDDSSFGEELLETFAEGIHGTRTGCGEIINDDILYKLLNLLFARHPEANKRLLYEAIHNQFPNKASVRELPQLYEDLKRRFEAQDPAVEEKLMAGYVDGTAFSSFRLLRCPRCFNYDCMLHGFGSAEDQEQPRRRSSAPTSTPYPCGPNCYRYAVKEEIPRKGLLSPGSKNINGTLHIKTDADSWTIGQESMFTVLKRNYKSDFCKIAACLNVVEPNAPQKTCRQVFAYSLRTGPLSPRAEISPNSPKKKKYVKDQHRTFRATKWASTEGKVTNHHNYEPCNHSGPCSEENNCNCVIVGNVCAKFCRCGDHCCYRFPGCRCGPGMCRTKQCQCFFANWECDPDICKSCGCDNLDGPASAICKNISMQRGLQKKLFIAPSQVAGWGCFTEEDIAKNDFISEYCGEVISHDESERRGKIYDKKKCSYLFGLNEEYLVDATRKGNVIRFANHSKDPNCKGRVFMVNGDHRIGIFARRNIAAGEELFFDYSYNSTQQIKFVSKERPKPH